MIRDNPKKFRLRRYLLTNRLKKVNSDPVYKQHKEQRIKGYKNRKKLFESR